jgi:hypothetical protein
MDRLQIGCHEVHVPLCHVESAMAERLLKQERRPALTNVVNPKRVTESMEATFWHSDTDLLAEHFHIPQNISPPSL